MSILHRAMYRPVVSGRLCLDWFWTPGVENLSGEQGCWVVNHKEASHTCFQLIKIRVSKALFTYSKYRSAVTLADTMQVICWPACAISPPPPSPWVVSSPYHHSRPGRVETCLSNAPRSPRRRGRFHGRPTAGPRSGCRLWPGDECPSSWQVVVTGCPFPETLLQGVYSTW